MKNMTDSEVLSIKELVVIRNEISKIRTAMTNSSDEKSQEYQNCLHSLNSLSIKLLDVKELENNTLHILSCVAAFNGKLITKQELETKLDDFLEAFYQFVMNLEVSSLERLFRSLAYANMACTDSKEATQTARIFRVLEEHASEISGWNEIVEIFEQ